MANPPESDYGLILRLARSVRVLNTLDVLATLLVVCVLGAPEWNPVQARMIDASPVAFVLVKLIGVAFFTVCLQAAYWHRPSAVFATLLLLNIVFVAALALHAACVVVAVSHA